MPEPAPADSQRIHGAELTDKQKALILGLFAVAMGYLEAAVVVYLRRIFYPHGFTLLMSNSISDSTFLVEPGRELATIIMLGGIAALSGRNSRQRFAWFLFVFGGWDIFYYVGLKALLNWPPSLLTWDILFLIPFPWVAPVLSPVLVAGSTIVFGLALIRLDRAGRVMRAQPVEWLMLAAGSLAVLWSYLSSYGAVAIDARAPSQLFDIHSELAARLGDVVPSAYSWWLLIVGLLAIWIAFARCYRRSTKRAK
jgi:hypothetical protein